MSWMLSTGRKTGLLCMCSNGRRRGYCVCAVTDYTLKNGSSWFAIRLSLLVLCSVQFAGDCVFCPWQLGVIRSPVSSGDQLAENGHGHLSGVRGKSARRDAEEGAAESAEGEVGGHSRK